MSGIAGWITSKLTGHNDQMGGLTNIASGVAGAIAGNWLPSFPGDVDFTGLKFMSLLFAGVGAVAVLAVVDLIFGRRKTWLHLENLFKKSDNSLSISEIHLYAKITVYR